MFQNAIPQFERGRILKTAMLEQLRDYPRHLAELHYQEYSDGVITGCHLEVGPDSLKVAPGMVKHQGRLYMLESPVELNYRASGKETWLKIRFHKDQGGPDWIIHSGVVVLEEEAGPQKTEMELARFKLKEGARLRQDYQSFGDLVTEYNTVNVLYVPYSAYRHSTLSPVIMRSYAEHLMRSGSLDPHDLVFAMMCANEGTLDRNVITHYISSRLGVEMKDYTNLEIHRYLNRILEGLRGGRNPGTKFQMGQARVIVD